MSPVQPAIAVDSTYDEQIDNDNDDCMTFSSGASIGSSITQYRFENGRRYHSYRDGLYYAPNDDRYATYEATVHHLWLLTLRDQLFLAPIENPQIVLDVGTGTGLWAIDMADQFPSAEIIGTDLSPIQDSTARPNVRFEVDDANAEWTYPESSIDFVHIRGLTGCIRDWPYLYQQCYKHLKPGGWFEHLEWSMNTNADPESDNHADKLYTAFSTSVMSIGEQRGMTYKIVDRMKEYMEDAGFVDIVETRFIWPIGPWPKDPHLKELGRWGERNWVDGIEDWVLAIYTRHLGKTYADVQAFARDLRSVVKARQNHFWSEARCVYGRKPLPEEIDGARRRETAGSAS